jgi:diadenylate cyclase
VWDDLRRHLYELSNPSWESLLHVLDIFIVAYLIYRILLLVRGSRAWLIIGGFVAFWALFIISSYAHLSALHWLLDKAVLLAPVALAILLLPELRQALEGVGKNPVWTHLLQTSGSQTEAQTVEEIVAAVAEMSSSSVGALIVLEKAAQLQDIASNGVPLGAKVTAPLLGSIFYEGNPLHDGAVVIRGDTIIAAACRLPLSESVKLSSNLHMRHRAAVGIAEGTDALAIVVSEERGSISIAQEGHLKKLASHQELRDILNKELRGVVDLSRSDDQRRSRRSRASRNKNRTA